MDTFLSYLTVGNLLSVLYLIVLEAVLSVDNALALAALVRGRLPNEADQKHALHWGIFGAYAFRITIIFAGVWLMQHEWVKWLSGGYLVYLGCSELFFKKHAADDGEGEVGGVSFKLLSPLWSTIVAVELMDIMFSVDSIAVAFSVSNLVPVLIAGAVFGILAMRYAAGFFIKLINKFPILEKTAFVLVTIAGLKIIAELLGFHVPEVVFMPFMFAVVGGSMALNKAKPEWFEETKDNKAA